MPSVSDSFSIAVRIYFGPQHIRSAAHFARMAYSHEQNGEDEMLMACVSSAVMLSAFSLEAMVNELASDVADRASSRPATNLNAPAKAAISSKANKLIRASNTRNKIQEILELAGVAQLDEDQAPYEPVNALFKFRNALVHYEVTNDVIASTITDQAVTIHDLQALLNGRFPLNPKYIPGGATGVISTWHQQLLSHGAADWAVKSAEAMFNEFNAKLGFPPPFDGLGIDLATRP